MDLKKGIKVTPELIAVWATKDDPDFLKNMSLRSYGYDKDEDIFFLIFETPDCPEGASVSWEIPKGGLLCL